MKTIQISDEAHAAVKAAAAGRSLSATASEMLLRPAAAVTPAAPLLVRGCGCDGPDEDGPHHRPGCGRRT